MSPEAENRSDRIKCYLGFRILHYHYHRSLSFTKCIHQPWWPFVSCRWVARWRSDWACGPPPSRDTRVQREAWVPRPRFVSLKVLSSGQMNIKFFNAWRHCGKDLELEASQRDTVEMLSAAISHLLDLWEDFWANLPFPIIVLLPTKHLLNSTMSFLYCVLKGLSD